MAMLVWWMARGRKPGDVFWYYVLGFGPAWRCQLAIASAWLYVAEKQRAHSDQVGGRSFVVALIGLLSPLALFL